jgi:hypothetical protein
MKRKTRNRDLSGRFRPVGYVDPKRVEIDKRIAEQNAEAERYIKLAKSLGLDDLIEYSSIKKNPKTGNWYVSHQARQFFYGIALGATQAMGESADKIAGVIKAFRS